MKSERFSQNNPNPSEALGERIPTPVEKLRGYLGAKQIELNRQFETMQKTLPVGKRITVAPDLRITPPPDLYGPAEKQFDEQGFLERYKTLDVAKIKSAEDQSAGTKFEMLKTAIMHKHMGERFIVVRSARYDDDKNG